MYFKIHFWVQQKTSIKIRLSEHVNTPTVFFSLGLFKHAFISHIIYLLVVECLVKNTFRNDVVGSGRGLI
jgi:hypothetical protein